MTSEERVALVTGGASGIGRATALELAAGGDSVVVADVDAEGGAATVDAVREGGGESLFVEVDVADATSVEDGVVAALERFGRIDVLVNSAGVQTDATLGSLAEADWDRVVDTNLKGVFLVTQRVTNAMVAAGVDGSVVTVSSVHQSLPRTARLSYDAAKAGVWMLTKEAALELAPHRINVNAVAPGAIETPMNREFLDDPDAEAAVRDLIPWDRWGRPEEVARAVAFLAADESAYITGSCLTVDGGYSLGGVG